MVASDPVEELIRKRKEEIEAARTKEFQRTALKLMLSMAIGFSSILFSIIFIGSSALFATNRSIESRYLNDWALPTFITGVILGVLGVVILYFTLRDYNDPRVPPSMMEEIKQMKRNK